MGSPFNKLQKQEFCKTYSWLINSIINYGYDSPQAMECEKILKREYGYNEKANRRVLLIPFVRIWTELNQPKEYIIVGVNQLNKPSPVQSELPEIPIVLSRETIMNRTHTEKQIMDFIEHKDHYMNKYPKNK